jgi:hypothetical protein
MRHSEVNTGPFWVITEHRSLMYMFCPSARQHNLTLFTVNGRNAQ